MESTIKVNASDLAAVLESVTAICYNFKDLKESPTEMAFKDLESIIFELLTNTTHLSQGAFDNMK